MAEEIDTKIGANVRRLRHSRALTQTELGMKCMPPITGAQVSKHEKGQDRITCERMVDFSRALNQPLLAFFEGIKVNS